jgi:ribosomal protein L11 methyltransferase
LADPGRRWPALDLSGPPVLSSPDDLLLGLDDYAVIGITEAAPSSWRVFFTDEASRDAACAGLGRRPPAAGLAVVPVDVPDEGWAARSQAGLRSVRVGGVIVAPPWDTPGDSAAVTIVIQPSMGFGTGHHASTRLCLAALQRLDVTGRTVLDIGTGSGLLAIAARLAGASPVTGIDRDPDAIASARENLALNPGASDVRLDVKDLAEVTGPADIVLANLTGALLARHAASLVSLAARGGVLVISGFTTAEEASVRAVFDRRAVRRAEDREGDWVAWTLEIPPHELQQ